MPYSLLLDLFVAALLVTTIAFAVVLNKRLGKLRGDREALEKLAATFGESTLRAEEGIRTLQQTTDVLQRNLDQAQALKDDLAFLIERGDRAADNLEDLVRATRQRGVIGQAHRFAHGQWLVHVRGEVDRQHATAQLSQKRDGFDLDARGHQRDVGASIGLTAGGGDAHGRHSTLCAGEIHYHLGAG